MECNCVYGNYANLEEQIRQVLHLQFSIRESPGESADRKRADRSCLVHPTQQDLGKQSTVQSVFRIHDILVWIRIRGSMPLTNGSGFGSGSTSWIRILLFSSLTFKMPAKKQFFNTIFSACYFLEVHLRYFSKIKSQKESQISRTQGFPYYFCMMIEGPGSGSRAGSIPLTSGSGSGSQKTRGSGGSGFGSGTLSTVMITV